ncbi:MAG: acyltransferase [Pseudomonadota bacterium]
MQKIQVIPPALSIHMDVLRIGAAMAVLLDHLMLRRYHGAPRDLNAGFDFGSDAVMVFFAISGFVIAHAAADRAPGAFAFARLTRLWSVMLPAVVLTFALDTWGRAVSPASYDGGFFNPLAFHEYVFFGLTFSNEWLWQSSRIGINGPLWSLSFEAAYYILFAVAFYMRGWSRIALLVLGAALFGPYVLLYMPAWLAGALAYFAWRRMWTCPRAILWVGAVGPVVIYTAVAIAGHPTGAPGLFPDLRFQAHLVWDLTLGIMTAVQLYAVGTLFRATPLRVPGAIPWLAGASFSLYVCHFPLIQITSALTGWTGASFILGGGAVAAIGSLAFAQAFERPLPRLRRRIKARFTRQSNSAATA